MRFLPKLLRGLLRKSHDFVFKNESDIYHKCEIDRMSAFDFAFL
nr:MAG TPA: hypothetical protein [Caudoviricetes sp.]